MRGAALRAAISAVGDLNGDGRADLHGRRREHQPASTVLRGTGDGGVRAPPSAIATVRGAAARARSPTSTATAAPTYWSSATTDSFAHLAQRGRQLRARRRRCAAAITLVDVAAADVNGDGRADLAAARPQPQHADLPARRRAAAVSSPAIRIWSATAPRRPCSPTSTATAQIDAADAQPARRQRDAAARPRRRRASTASSACAARSAI